MWSGATRTESPSGSPRKVRPRTPHQLLAFALSLPERSLRALVGLLGGLGRALTHLVPGPLRESRFFRTAVERQLRIMTDLVGRAELYRDADEVLDAQTTLRMGVGGAIDNLMILGLHASPIWIFLAATDLCEGAKSITREVALELKTAGFMQEGSRLDSVDDVLEGLAGLSKRLAETLDKPPLTLADMKSTVAAVRLEVVGVADTAATSANIDALAQDLKELAQKGRHSILEVSSAVALGALHTTGNLVAGTVWGAAATVRILGEKLWSDVVLDYARAARRIHRLGYYGALRSFLRPQSASAGRLFAYSFVTWTERVLSLGTWRQATWTPETRAAQSGREPA